MKFKFDASTGSVDKYYLDSGTKITPANASWNSATKLLSFQITVSSVTYTLSGTYSVVATPGNDYFSGGTCTYEPPKGD